MADKTNNLSAAQIEACRKNSRKSTGPRAPRGKWHSSRNSRKHGLYSDVNFFYWDAAIELGEDPREFERLFAGLIEARQPADRLERVLLEDIAVLVWKKARLERAESAVQVCNVHKHDLERRKQFIQVGRDVSTVSQTEAFEKGLRVALDAPGKFEKVISMLGILEEMTERNEFTPDTQRILLALYGQEPTLRGAGLPAQQLAQAAQDAARGAEIRRRQDSVRGEPGGREHRRAGGIRTVSARACGEHAGGADRGQGALARPVGGHHPAAECVAPATGAEDPPAG